MTELPPPDPGLIDYRYTGSSSLDDLFDMLAILPAILTAIIWILTLTK